MQFDKKDIVKYCKKEAAVGKRVFSDKTPTQVLFVKFFKNTFFIEHLQWLLLAKAHVSADIIGFMNYYFIFQKNEAGNIP